MLVKKKILIMYWCVATRPTQGWAVLFFVLCLWQAPRWRFGGP
jgi:hypothetical protein